MAKQPKKKFKYSVHLATPAVIELEDFLTENAKAKSLEKKLRTPLDFECKLFHKPAFSAEPKWATNLNQYFEIDGAIKSASAAAVVLFKCEGRVVACSYGHGQTMLDSDKRENDFGLLVAANSLSDENVKLVEKADLGSVIRDATQAAGITRLQEFNVDRALNLVRRLSGSTKDEGSSLSGASSITMVSGRDIDELHKLAGTLLKLYDSKTYQGTGFGIIDKIKPVTSIEMQEELDQLLLENLNSDNPSFELGAPEIDTEPIGFLTISGTGKRTTYPDISLETLLAATGELKSTDDLHRYRIVTWNIDGAFHIKRWSVHRGLVGSLEKDGHRFALNEGKWYQIDQLLKDSANGAFEAVSKGRDTEILVWPTIGRGKKGKTPVYEPEKEFNERVVNDSNGKLLLFDRKMVPIPNTPGPGVELCDLFDIESKKLIHVKRSSRRSSIISHFLTQGMNSAKFLRLYDRIRNDFFDLLEAQLPVEKMEELKASFPRDWTVEFKFGDRPNAAGDYTIPFFSRVTLDETKREIEALGFKAVEVSFIHLPS